MKIKIIVFCLFLLFSCKEKECEKPKKLIDFGGSGRNEISFLINGKEVWYSRVDNSNGEKGVQMLDNPYGGYKIIMTSFTNLNTCDVFDSDYNFFKFSLISGESNKFKFFNDFTYLDGTPLESTYEMDSLSPLKLNCFYNEEDSIIYGSFEGVMYHTVYLDTLFITKGNFDFKVE